VTRRTLIDFDEGLLVVHNERKRFCFFSPTNILVICDVSIRERFALQLVWFLIEQAARRNKNFHQVIGSNSDST
jgi:hypothetical protein